MILCQHTFIHLPQQQKLFVLQSPKEFMFWENALVIFFNILQELLKKQYALLFNS